MRSSRHAMLTALILLLVWGTAGSAIGAVASGYPYVPGEIIVKFRPSVAAGEKAEVFRTLDGAQVKTFNSIGAEQWQIKGESVEDAVARLEADPRVEYAQPNYVLHALEIPNDTRFGDLWGMNNNGDFTDASGNVAVADADIDAVEAWDVFTGSSDVIVAVIDTGVDYNHPDLVDNIWTNPGEIAGNGIDDDNNGYIDDIHGWDFANGDSDPMDDNDHGTHCSGTIGGTGNNALGVAGVNWDVSIMGLKFLTSSGSGSTADALSCIEYATLMGVDVMSNSWGGGPYDAAMDAAIQAAYEAGIFFVAAAGNSGNDNDASDNYPSNYTAPNVIAVLATDCTDSAVNEPGWWSTSYGATTVDIGAPGLHIWSTTPGNTYSDFSGTSMATPHVAGAMAMLRGRFPNISVDAGKNLLMTIGNDPVPALDGLCVTGGRLNLLKLIADPDSIPPSDVTDLAVSNVASNWIELSWTAPGDDGATGTASSYSVRYAAAPILTEADWDAATVAGGAPDPAAAGTPETMRVDGLDVLTTYHFAIRALDEYGNQGNVSNSPSATTLAPPSIGVSPAFLSASLETGGAATETLTITNTGDGVLDFSLPTPEYIMPAKGGFAAVPTYEYLPLAKGEIDKRPGVGGDKALGGPDAFGYNWRDSDEAGGPAFNWIEINAVGTAVSLGDDANGGPYAIGFPFEFYGVDYSEFNICSNGWISFTDSGTEMSNGPLPSSGAPLNMLALFWDDLNPGSGGSIYYHNDGTRLIVEFENVPHYDNGGLFTMQAHLYPNGAVEYHYLSMGTVSNSGTIGIQNADGTDGLTVVSNAAYVHDNMAVRFLAITPWLATSPSSGSLAAGASIAVDVNFSASGLCGSHFDANLHVISNDPANPDVVVPAGLDLTGTPDIAADLAALDFGEVYVTALSSLDLVLSNNGCADLTISALNFDNGDFSATATTPIVLTAGAVETVVVVYEPSAAGPAAGVLSILSDDADTPSLDITLSGVGLDFPDIAVAPDSLSASLASGGTATQTLTITNNGLGDLDFTIPEAEYLTAKNAAKSAPKPGALPIDLAKDEADPRLGAPVVLGAGGPDVFGYKWKDSDELGGPAYNWIEIENVGTAIPLSGDDQNLGPFPIGFSFPFYGTDFTEFNACSNGWLSFTSTATTYTNYDLPSVSAPANLIAPFHDDLTFSSSGTAWYHYDGQRLIVEYKDAPRLSSGGPYTFQVHLYPSGRIEFHYQSMLGTRLNEATIGIQNADGTDGLAMAFNADYVHDGLAVRIEAQEPWLAVSPATGTVAPGASADVTVTFSASGLCGDQYAANLHVLSNDPDTPDATVPVSLELLGEPDALPSDTALDFGVVQLTQSATLPLGLANVGCATLNVTGIEIDNAVFAVDAAAPLAVAPGEVAQLNVTFTPASADTAYGVLTLTTDDPDAPVQTVNLVGSASNIGQIAVSPAEISASVMPDSSTTATLTVTNNGAGELNFSVPSPVMYDQVIAQLPPVVGKPVAPKPKDAADDEFGVAPLGAGGPDVYGYEWIDSDEAGGPVFDWIDVTATGTAAMTSGDDSNLGPFPIGFPFEFYGTTFTEFRVSSNGFISFSSTLTAYSNSALPNASAPLNLIAPFWDDLNLNASGSGDVWYGNVDGNLVVQYDNVMPYSTSTSGAGPFSFEVILKPSGEILLQYLSLNSPNASHTVGIQDGTGAVGLNVAYNTAYLHDNMAIRIRSGLEWLTCSPASGTIPAGGSVDLTVGMNAAGMELGAHTGLLTIVSDDPLNPSVDVPVTMMVSDMSPVGETGLPRVTVLNQNVPNPFNPQTTVKFALPHSGKVELKIYDVRGAAVRTLVSGHLEAGQHEAVWQGRDDAGRRVPSGVYFSRLVTDDGVLTRRMTMIK
jgi:subtilisin family serine protease